MSSVVAFDEAKRRLEREHGIALPQGHPLPSSDGLENIPRSDLGYPGCSGHVVTEPDLDYDQKAKILLVTFEGSEKCLKLDFPSVEADFVLRDGYAHSFRWVLAAFLVMNGVHFRQAGVWLPDWLPYIVETFAKLNNAEQSGKNLGYSPTSSLDGGELTNNFVRYADRKDRTINARDYLEQIYGAEIAKQNLTLSELRKRDESLWRALRNWAHHGGHDLDAIIPRGRTARQLNPEKIEVAKQQLDPNDFRDALALQALRVREQTRERVKRHRQRSSKLIT